MSNQAELEAKTQQVSDEASLIPSGETILEQIGINSPTVKAMKGGTKRSYYRAVINWLMKYKANPKASNLEKVKGLLEAFYHLCEIEDWEKAKTIFLIRLSTSAKEYLCLQLGVWGYYKKQIQFCLEILSKLDVTLNLDIT